jgi:plastocyanin
MAALISGAGLLLRAQAPQEVGTWASIGAAPENRIGAAAVTLADGRTLIIGGLAGGTATDAVIIFDPDNGSFAAAGQLLDPRTGHTATLLDDGRVLIAGGMVSELLSGALEIFDPSTGSSTLTATLAQPRSGHCATRLSDGTVLIAGGTGTDGVVLQTVEIFNPATGAAAWTTSLLQSARTGASATLLIDGRVLVAGGSDGTEDLASAEIYNPFTQEFQPTDTNLDVPRSGHVAVLLPYNNSVLIAGGSSNGMPQSATDLFLPAQFPDPYTYGMGQFAPTGAMAAPRSGAAGGPHVEGYAFVIGGGAADAEVYRFATIKTDKDDYAPGQLAIITGSGWRPNEAVTLLFQEDPAVHDDYVITVTADAEGNIHHDQWAPERHDLNVRFYLLAKQLTAQGERRAQTTFTDAELITAELTPVVNDVTVTQGSSASFTISLSATGKISDLITAASPATARVTTAYSLSSSGALTSTTFSSNFSFFAGSTGCSGNNCDVTWTGAPAPYSVPASITADASTPVGDYTITLSLAAGTTSTTAPNVQGGKLDDGTPTIIKVHVVAPAAGHIVVNKVTNPSGDTESFSFDAGGGTYADFSLTDAAAPNDQTLVPGTYSVSETVPAGWDLTSATCSSSIGDTETPASIELDAGETVTCTFTNTKRGHIIVDKVTYPSGDPQSFNFTVTGTGYSNFTLTDAAAANDQTLMPGTYSVSESAVPGWDLTSATCSSSIGDTETPASIELDAGETVTCTFTNTTRGHIIVDKVTNPSGDTKSFSFDAGGGTYADFSLTDAATPNDQTLVPGTYSVSETVPAGWDLTSATCSSSIGDTETPASIELDAGEIVTCTFTNTKRGRIVVDKVTNPSGDPQSFSFDAGGGTYADFSLTDAAAPNDQALVPGTYSVSEAAVLGWDLTSTVCSDGSPVTAIAVAAGETVTCTFTNTKRGHIIVDKVTYPSGDPQSFSFDASGGTYADFSLTDAAAPNDQMLVPGTYSVSEAAVVGWDLTGTICSDGSPVTAIALAAGETVTCTFTNTKRGQIQIVKSATPAAGTFSFTVTGPTGPWSFSLAHMGFYTTPLVPAGPGYAASETAVPGWTTSASCDNGSPVTSIVVLPGSLVTCTFTNTNPPPTASITGPPSGANVFAVNTLVTFTGTFTDSYGDSHTVAWKFDDPLLSTTGTANPNPGNSGSANASYTFTSPGVYAVKLIVTDGAGQSAEDTTTPDGLPAMIVVYDPNGGFVTGGGWINSPPGAYRPDESLSGKANFGFVSKYQKGANTPTGETEFQFKAGDLNFHSTTYQWLVVAGAKAQYKGTGRVNGVDGYSFMLTATDGQVSGGGGVDKFRIKIWETSTGDVVYDNNFGASDDIDVADPQAISGGSIVIHK